jgi:dynein heavy chain
MIKQTVAPLQAEEVNRIRRELVSFDVQQHEFRDEFRKIAPFNYTSKHPYITLDRVSSK